MGGEGELGERLRERERGGWSTSAGWHQSGRPEGSLGSRGVDGRSLRGRREEDRVRHGGHGRQVGVGRSHLEDAVQGESAHGSGDLVSHLL